MLPAAFIDPGDITLMTVPGYPVAGTATRWFGGTVHKLPLLPENDFFPDLDGISTEVLARTKMMVLCYPNSPTGKTATREFYERVVAFAVTNRILIVQDAAHIMLSYDEAPLSFLSIDGAKDSMEALGTAAPGTRLRQESSPLNFSTTTASFGAGRPLPRDNGDAGDAGDAGRGSGAVHSLVDTARAPRGRKPRRLVRCSA